jgi:hypothetical protein
MIGSAAFMLGSAPFVGTLLDSDVIGATFFAGSVCFTAAALQQYVQAAGEGGSPWLPAIRRRRLRLLAAHPRSIDWWATGVQLVGTLFFNITTFAALNDALSTQQAERRVWAPDALGSVCFLAASYLAFVAVSRARFAWRPHDHVWRIAASNLLGSVFFGISAVTSIIVPDTGAELNTAATNTFTFLGAAGFLAGAAMLLPEARQGEATARAGP